MVKDSPVTLTAEADGENVKLTADAAVEQRKPLPITFYDGDREIGTGMNMASHNSITVPAASLARVAALHAVVGAGEGRFQSRPVMWIAGYGQVK